MALAMPFSALEMWKSFRPGNAVYLTEFVIKIFIDCLLWLFISRRASNVAKWLWVCWIIVPLISIPFLSIMAGGNLIGAFLLHGAPGAALDVTALLLRIVAAIMLFRPDAAKWFANRGMVFDASIFS